MGDGLLPDGFLSLRACEKIVLFQPFWPERAHARPGGVV